MPEWLKGTGCKPVGIAYAGSNPAPPIATQRIVETCTKRAPSDEDQAASAALALSLEGMTDLTDRAREALEAQGFNDPGPKLTGLVMDAVAREQEETPAGVRIHRLEDADLRELLADTPELEDHPLKSPTTPNWGEVLADIINEAKNYILHDERRS